MLWQGWLYTASARLEGPHLLALGLAEAFLRHELRGAAQDVEAAALPQLEGVAHPACPVTFTTALRMDSHNMGASTRHSRPAHPSPRLITPLTE